MIKTLTTLISVGVLEKDLNNDLMLSWCYPSIPKNLEPIIRARSRLESSTVNQFIFSKFESNWLYFFATVLHENDQKQANQQAVDVDGNSTEDPERTGPLPAVNVFSVFLVTKDFNPEMYGNLCRVFASVYASSGSPLNILSFYLSTLTTGSCGTEEGQTFNMDDHDRRAALLATPLKALMMKKRIVVVSENLVVLLKVIRSFPLYVSHRQDWELLRPFMNSSNVELEELKKAGVYVAGFVDDRIHHHTDLYDVYVDINSRTISVADHAKTDFRLGSFHKDLGVWMSTTAEDVEVPNPNFVRELASKTREFLNKLSSLSVTDDEGNQYISWENLQERKLPPNMDHFLFAVAQAEGLTKETSR